MRLNSSSRGSDMCLGGSEMNPVLPVPIACLTMLVRSRFAPYHLNMFAYVLTISSSSSTSVQRSVGLFVETAAASEKAQQTSSLRPFGSKALASASSPCGVEKVPPAPSIASEASSKICNKFHSPGFFPYAHVWRRLFLYYHLCPFY